MSKPNPHCDDTWRWAFGRLLGHEWGALVNGISALTEETPGSSLSLLLPYDNSEKTTVSEPGNRLLPDTESACTLNLDFPVSRIMRSKSLLF